MEVKPPCTAVHILGLMKNFVKALNKEGYAFIYLKNIFPHISDAKLMGGIFNGPQIRELMKNDDFDRSMNDNELNAWISLKMLSNTFLVTIEVMITLKSYDFEII